MTPTALDGRKDMTHVEYGSAASSRSCRIPVLFTVALLLALAFAGNALGAVTPVGLGTADSFAVLAGSTITNTGPTTVIGDIGLWPGTSETGFGSITQTGTNHVTDAVAQGAQSDLTIAYNTAAGETPVTSTIVADLGGQTLTAGIYKSPSSIGLTGTLTLDGAGNPNAMFVFQATDSTLITASASTVKLINGASPCNVFWQVGSSATLGTGSTFRGTILALTSITVTSGVTVDGRVLARNGAVTLDSDKISNTCKGTSPPPTDTTPPKCTLTATTFVGGIKGIQVTVQDTGSGLASIVPTSTNATTPTPSFTPGTIGPVVVFSNKIIQTAGSIVSLTVKDVAGNVRTCDPLWPGKKAAKPTSRAKHHRIGRHATGWGRRTT